MVRLEKIDDNCKLYNDGNESPLTRDNLVKILEEYNSKVVFEDSLDTPNVSQSIESSDKRRYVDINSDVEKRFEELWYVTRQNSIKALSVTEAFAELNNKKNKK